MELNDGAQKIGGESQREPYPGVNGQIKKAYLYRLDDAGTILEEMHLM